MTTKAKRDNKRKINVINYARKTGNVHKACRHYGLSKTIFYVCWQGIKRMEKKA